MRLRQSANLLMQPRDRQYLAPGTTVIQTVFGVVPYCCAIRKIGNRSADHKVELMASDLTIKQLQRVGLPLYLISCTSIVLQDMVLE